MKFAFWLALVLAAASVDKSTHTEHFKTGACNP